jgi:NTP pyrophosphatase (non-canonical NTP hydrolase)
MEINETAVRAHATAQSKGWYDPPKSLAEQIAMIHSEVSEALEEGRNGRNRTWYKMRVLTEDDIQNLSDTAIRVYEFITENQKDLQYSSDNLPQWFTDGVDELVSAGVAKPEGLPSELADIIIRVFDSAVFLGVDLEKAISEKMAYNATRPHRHGGKKW